VPCVAANQDDEPLAEKAPTLCSITEQRSPFTTRENAGRTRGKFNPLPAKSSHSTLRKHISAPTPPFCDLRHALDSFFFPFSKCLKVGERCKGLVRYLGEIHKSGGEKYAKNQPGNRLTPLKICRSHIIRPQL